LAGERKGITYEAIVKIALEKLVRKGDLKGQVFWNERPEAMTIEPDLTVGADKDHPTHVMLVTHSGSAKNSDMKFWRNIGELAEAKSSLASEPLVFSIVFDAEIKQELKDVQAAAFDGQLIVADRHYGPSLNKWIDRNQGDLPARGLEKVDALMSLLKSDRQLRALVSEVTRDLRTLIAARRPELQQLWSLHRRRTAKIKTVARDTYYRRAFAKALVLRIKPVDAIKPLKGNWDWALPLGLVRKSLAGYRVVDPDLIWLSTSALKDVDPGKWSEAFVSDGFRAQAQKVRSVALLPEFQRYVLANISELKTTAGMKKHLEALHSSPSIGLTLPYGVPAPLGVWLFDYIGALVKARAKKAQVFGYSTFSKHATAAASKIGNMDIGTWCACFMNQFFSRRSTFSAPNAAVELVAEVLAEQLGKFTPESIVQHATEVERRYVSKELVSVLLAHPGFDPIGALVDSTEGIRDAIELRIRAGFAERRSAGGGSASTSVLRICKTLVKWQSAHESHTNDKRKELCGRAPALKYSWDTKLGRFVRRPGIERLLLIVDGTWTQTDLDALARAGWDGIFYPDELDQLVQSIV
jgi:hypothetical protein